MNIDWYSIAASSIAGGLLLLMTLGVAFSIFAPALDKWNRRYLISLFSLQLVCVVLCFVEALFYENPDMVIPERIVDFANFVLMLPLVLMPTVFIFHCCGESLKSNPLVWVFAALGAMYLGCLIAAPFTDAFFTIGSDATFTRGNLFPLLLSPLVVIMSLNFIIVLVKRKKLAKRYFASSMVYLLPLTAALFAHMFIFSEIFVLLGVGLWALTIMALVVNENTEKHLRQEREIANQRASILVLQMRPHFIYNTMTSIYYLCDQNPSKAKQVTLDFTTYLRKNFAAIASGSLIPFADELEHTRAYLAVEQAQFEDALFVDFDTPDTSFRLPPLTLQPIVENAVKHGLVESKTPIHISVKTRQIEKAHEILVEDDGPGFVQSNNDEPHIALNNIRQRLEMMCKGTLEISSTPGGGTTVKVVIPEKLNGSEEPPAQE